MEPITARIRTEPRGGEGIPKSVAPSVIWRRLESFADIAAQIQAGLDGTPFRWGSGERNAFAPKAAAMGATLVTASGARKRGYRLKERVKAVGTAYYDAPLQKWAELYVLECQCVPAGSKKK